VLKAGNDKLVRARILMCDATRQVMANGLWLLGMKVPDEM
jgi:arginyl-tRNA synthetase